MLLEFGEGGWLSKARQPELTEKFQNGTTELAADFDRNRLADSMLKIMRKLSK